MDNRGSATGIARFFLALLVGAIVTWIVYEITNPLFSHVKDSGGDPVQQTATGYLEVFQANLPVIFLLFAFFSLLALAVFQREILRS